ncbi:uncharacterized protein LOC144167329 isoform X2 [Haemaphysalis longicornis]
MKALLLLIFASSILAEKKPVPFDTPPMNYCYEKLNPVEASKARKMSSDLFFACKHELFRFDVKPGIIMEVNRFCVSFRFCWSVAEERSSNRQTMIDYVFYCLDKLALANMTVKSDWAQKYHYNHSHQLAAFKS